MGSSLEICSSTQREVSYVQHLATFLSVYPPPGKDITKFLVLILRDDFFSLLHPALQNALLNPMLKYNFLVKISDQKIFRLSHFLPHLTLTSQYQSRHIKLLYKFHTLPMSLCRQREAPQPITS